MAISKASVFILLGILAASQARCTNDLAKELIGHVWRFQSYNYPSYYIRHRNYWARIDKSQRTKLYRLDSSWKVVKGLCGCGISFQSKNYPRHYLRHRNYWARIDRYDHSRLFRKDACFIPRRGLADEQDVSFESVNYRGYFLRHRNYWMRIDRRDGSSLFRKDATFLPQHVWHYKLFWCFLYSQ